jgi:hypothetical protein
VKDYDKHIKELGDAIDAIPVDDGGQGGRDAFVAFVQGATSLSVDLAGAQMDQWDMVHADMRGMGFCPVQPTHVALNSPELVDAVLLYAEVVENLPPFTDILSPLHARFVFAAGRKLAQAFTPWSLALTAARLNWVPIDKPDYKVADITCGAGALLLAYAKVAHDKQGAAALLQLGLFANDIDSLCCAMTVLQLTANQMKHGLPIGRVEVSCGDIIKRSGSVVFASVASAPLAVAKAA